MNARSRNFLAASEVSPVVYGSVDDGKVTYRLADGKVFHLNAEEARAAPHPHWAFHRADELKLLKKLKAEARKPERYPER